MSAFVGVIAGFVALMTAACFAMARRRPGDPEQLLIAVLTAILLGRMLATWSIAALGPANLPALVHWTVSVAVPICGGAVLGALAVVHYLNSAPPR